MSGFSPDNLSNLALASFSDYIHKTVQNWRFPTASLNIEWIRRFCGKVHEQLSNVKLTSEAANDVTMRLLRGLDMWIDPDAVNSDDAYRLAITHLTSALVLPNVTHLNFLQDESYYFYDGVEKLLSQDVSEMKLLKVLQLQNIPLHIERLSFPYLQELTISYECNDRVIEILLVTSGNIKTLDVSNSRSVTNASIQFLVKFTHLEKLNIWHTNISPKGLTQLLTELSNNKDSVGISLLNSLGCEFLDNEQLKLLVYNFTNLMKLELTKFDSSCDVSLLGTLQHLRSFTMSSGSE